MELHDGPDSGLQILIDDLNDILVSDLQICGPSFDPRRLQSELEAFSDVCRGHFKALKRPPKSAEDMVRHV